jgi:hypothetical protein
MKNEIKYVDCPMCDSKDTSCYECKGQKVSEFVAKRIKRELTKYFESETLFDYYMEDKIFGEKNNLFKDI